MKGRKTLALSAMLGLAVLTPILSHANVNLVLRPLRSDYRVGEVVQIDVVAISDQPTQTVSALDVIVKWNSLDLNPLSSSNSRCQDANGAYSWFASGFINPTPLNDSRSDGDAVWSGLAQFLMPYVATDVGTVVTTLRFNALRKGSIGRLTKVDLPPTYLGFTAAIFGGDFVNQNVTGTFIGCEILIHPAAVGPHG